MQKQREMLCFCILQAIKTGTGEGLGTRLGTRFYSGKGRKDAEGCAWGVVHIYIHCVEVGGGKDQGPATQVMPTQVNQ